MVVALVLGFIGVCFLIMFLSSFSAPEPIKLAGRHVLITGGSSGIGLALATLAAREGAHVTILARNVSKIESAKLAIRKDALSPSQRIEGVSADICVWESINDGIARAVELSGPLDVLVCNAGTARPGVFETEPIETLKFEMNLNWLGTVQTIKAGLPVMKDRVSPGCIAIVSSQAGQVGLYGYSGYSSSKFALRGLAEVLRQELLPYNIRVCLVHPSDTETPGMVEEDKAKPELTKQLSGSSDYCQPHNVAQSAIEGIKNGSFFVSVGFTGWLLCTVSAGMSPQPFLISQICEVLSMGLIRVIALLTLSDWYRTINKWHHERKKDR